MAAPVVASYATAHVIYTSGDVTVTKPTGVTGAAGEWLFAYYLTAGDATPTHTPPTDFDLIDSRAETYYGGPGRGSVYRKKTTGSEPANYTFDSGVSSNTYGLVEMWRVTGCDETTPVDVYAYTNTVAPASNYIFPSVTTTGPDRLLLIFGGLANNPSGSEWPLAVPTGFTRQAYINDTGEFVNVGSASKTQASAGASGTFSVPFNDLENMAQGFTLAIAPASSDTSVAPGAGSLTITGYAPAVGAATSIAPGAGALALTGYAPALTTTTSVAAGAGSLAFTGYAPTLNSPSSIAAGAGSLVFAGFAPSLTTSSAVAPGAGALTVSGYAPTLAGTTTVAPGAGALAFTGYAPTLAAGGVQVGRGTLLFVGFAPTLQGLAPEVRLIPPVNNLEQLRKFANTLIGELQLYRGRYGTALPDVSTVADGAYFTKTDEAVLYQNQNGAWVAVDGVV